MAIPDTLALAYPLLDEFKLRGTFWLQTQRIAVGVLKLEHAAKPLHWSHLSDGEGCCQEATDMSPVSYVSGRNRNRGAAVTLVLELGFWT